MTAGFALFSNCRSFGARHPQFFLTSHDPYVVAGNSNLLHMSFGPFTLRIILKLVETHYKGNNLLHELRLVALSFRRLPMERNELPTKRVIFV
jgi:hypothetical protein